MATERISVFDMFKIGVGPLSINGVFGVNLDSVTKLLKLFV
jgi:hypothetical protein